MKGLITLLLICFSLVSLSQERILKDFAEKRKDFKVCLYPSTLRMVNIQKDPEYNALVKDIDKLLIYGLDSATVAEKAYTEWTNDYINNGFEEYVSMSGMMNLVVLGKEGEFVGVTGAQDRVIAFYLKGSIAFQKIPKLIQTFEGGDMLEFITDQLDN